MVNNALGYHFYGDIAKIYGLGLHQFSYLTYIAGNLFEGVQWYMQFG